MRHHAIHRPFNVPSAKFNHIVELELPGRITLIVDCPKSLGDLSVTRKLYRYVVGLEFELHCFHYENCRHRPSAERGICPAGFCLCRDGYFTLGLRSTCGELAVEFRRCRDFGFAEYLSCLGDCRNIHRHADGRRCEWLYEHGDTLNYNYDTLNDVSGYPGESAACLPGRVSAAHVIAGQRVSMAIKRHKYWRRNKSNLSGNANGQLYGHRYGCRRMHVQVASRFCGGEPSPARNDYCKCLSHYLRIGSDYAHRAGGALLLSVVRRLDGAIRHRLPEYAGNLHIHGDGDRFQHAAVFGSLGTVYNSRVSAAPESVNYSERAYGIMQR